ncbi:MAG: hypothetical protein ACJ735_15095 [Actinomycetes bacterium]
MTMDEPPRTLAPYTPALDRGARALAVAAVVCAAVELGVGPHRVLSVVFVVTGLLIGYGAGRQLGAMLAESAMDAPVVSEAELALVAPAQPSPLLVAALGIGVLIAIAVPLGWHVPTPLPGGFAAGAVQFTKQVRGLRGVESKRRGQILRPLGQLSFDGDELRLRPSGVG